MAGSEKRKAVVAGAGIGGLTAALALHDAGWDVTVIEAVAELRPLGVGINLLPHAVAVLARFGLQEKLAAAGVETRAVVFANRWGQTIHEDLRGHAGGAAHPQVSIHRGLLQMILLEAVRARLAASVVRAGVAAQGWSEAGGCVTVETAAGPISADLLVAADGIHSALRSRLFPNEGPPRWNGVMMWRGVTVAAPFLDGRTMVQAGTGDAKFVVYPITRAAGQGAPVRINWIADIRVAPRIDGTRPAPSREDWSKPGRIEDLIPVFGKWRFDWMDVPGIIASADAIYEWPMVDRDPLPRWSFGRATLLGDAAHPMYPIGSNGATQAILDADALARALAEEADVPAALAAYEAARRPMASEIVRRNRALGLDAILDLVDSRAPNGFQNVSDVIDPADVAAMIGDYKQAAGHGAGGR